MPGIAGLIGGGSPDERRRLVERMTTSMLHDKDCISGVYSAPRIGAALGWVSREGSFSDCQPILNERGDVALVFSGECYSDDPETRARLRQSGHAFSSNNAEWLVHLYEERGDRFFAELNGLFSGLLIDQRRGLAFLFNDRYGMERIYYHEAPDGFFFASEAKALLHVLPELRAFDDRGLAQMLAFGCTLEWRSLFRGIGVLPGGSLWRFRGSRCTKGRHFVPAVWETQSTLPPASFEAQFKDTLYRIVPRYFDCDSGVGISLTGGLDTRMIMACRPRHRLSPVCYTFGGQEGDSLDVRLARRVASASALPHHVLRIGPDFFSDFESIADRTVYITDGCLGVTGAHEIYLNRQARELALVRLTGNFGSEILRGVTTFKPLGLPRDLVEPDLVRGIAEERSRVGETRAHPVSFAAFCEIPWSLFGVWRAAQSQLVMRTPYLDSDLAALAFRSSTALRDSTGTALRLVRDAAGGFERIPTDSGSIPRHPGLSSLLRSLWCRASFKLDYWCNHGMPHGLTGLDSPVSWLGQRTGLAGVHRYLHYREWLRKELADYLRDQLAVERTRGAAFWNRRFLDRLAARHTTGKLSHAGEINAVLTLGATRRLLLSGPHHATAA